jgi:hypothetical protein
LYPCKIDPGASTTFSKLVSHWQNDYPHVAEDLRGAFVKIEQDYRGAAHARATPGFQQKVWKYRQNSSDIRRGARYGLRLIAYYHEPTNTLYPIIVYPKPEWADVSRKDTQEAVKELLTLLSPDC